jgi:KipI family sensor histidine kinase inhibitor
LRERGPEGLLDAVAGARTLFCSFRPESLEYAALVRAIDGAARASVEAVVKRTHRIPVLYGGEAGPDLAQLAGRAGASEAELARRHAAPAYRVAFLGFAPGFAYMTGLPAGLDAPRRATPRPRVPGESVALAGGYTGIYPEAGPGGWNLIGRAAVRLFDPGARRPALFEPGDEVRFEPQDSESFARALARIPPAAPLPPLPGTPVFRVEKAGLSSAVCGAARHGLGAIGVPPSGAMDWSALAGGNGVLGNSAGAAALEVAVAGPALEVLDDCEIATAGAPCDARVDGREIPYGAPVRVLRGSRVAIGSVHAGVRSYLCISGGFSVSPAPGIPARIVAGDILFVHGPAPEEPPGPREALAPFAADPRDAVVRIVLGPQEDRFPKEGISTLLDSPFRVSSTSDRRGIRLEGPPLAHLAGADIPPEGTALGAIQVPADGNPIVLGPDRPVTGGYVKIATVIGADFPLIAQARPGSMLRFQAVSVEAAVRARGRMR